MNDDAKRIVDSAMLGLAGCHDYTTQVLAVMAAPINGGAAHGLHARHDRHRSKPIRHGLPLMIRLGGRSYAPQSIDAKYRHGTLIDLDQIGLT